MKNSLIIFFSLVVAFIVASFSVSCLRGQRHWMVVCDPSLKAYRLVSGITIDNSLFPRWVPTDIIDGIASPADTFRTSVLNNFRASEHDIADSQLREFDRVIGLSKYASVVSLKDKRHLIIAQKSEFSDHEVFEFVLGTGFTLIE